MSDQAQQGTALRRGKEGSRWWNERPAPDAVAEWFKSIPIHEDLEHDRYVGGIVLIEQKVKTKEIDGYRENGAPIIRDGVENLTFTPYPKVETRVQYFHDLMGKHPDWMGIIEPVGGGEAGFPPGFGLRTIGYKKEGADRQERFVCCTQRVTVFDRATVEERVISNGRQNFEVVRTGKTIIAGPPATKMVPLLAWGKPDEYMLMKAETGAVGRALGMAGMLVVPGAGVATADDMHEAQATGGGADEPGGAEAGPVPPDPGAGEGKTEEAQLRETATVVLGALKDRFPKDFEEFREWAEKERGIQSINDIKEVSMLKGIVRKAEKTLDAADKRETEAKAEPPAEK